MVERKSVKRKPDTGAGRKYIRDATKAALHPVRTEILKILRSGAKTAVELGEIIGEPHQNLYYHLTELEEVGLVGSVPVDRKTKRYELKVPRKPEAAVLIFSEEDIRTQPVEFNSLAAAAEKMEGAEIPYREKIVRAEITFYYSWDRE